jgi:hypothetical protein
LLRERLRNNQLRRAFHGGLRVIGQHKAIRPFYNARFRGAEIVLGLLLGFGFLGFFLVRAVFFGLLPGSRLQSALGFTNPFQPHLPSA